MTTLETRFINLFFSQIPQTGHKSGKDEYAQSTWNSVVYFLGNIWAQGKRVGILQLSSEELSRKAFTGSFRIFVLDLVCMSWIIKILNVCLGDHLIIFSGLKLFSTLIKLKLFSSYRYKITL